jgi:hypothetical protein
MDCISTTMCVMDAVLYQAMRTFGTSEFEARGGISSICDSVLARTTSQWRFEDSFIRDIDCKASLHG